jgi:hypothetical protein
MKNGMKKFRENRISEAGKKNFIKKRKEHVERSFADSKQNHGYRYAMYKGVKKKTNIIHGLFVLLKI